MYRITFRIFSHYVVVVVLMNFITDKHLTTLSRTVSKFSSAALFSAAGKSLRFLFLRWSVPWKMITSFFFNFCCCCFCALFDDWLGWLFGFAAAAIDFTCNLMLYRGGVFSCVCWKELFCFVVFVMFVRPWQINWGGHHDIANAALRRRLFDFADDSHADVWSSMRNSDPVSWRAIVNSWFSFTSIALYFLHLFVVPFSTQWRICLKAVDNLRIVLALSYSIGEKRAYFALLGIEYLFSIHPSILISMSAAFCEFLDSSLLWLPFLFLLLWVTWI